MTRNRRWRRAGKFFLGLLGGLVLLIGVGFASVPLWIDSAPAPGAPAAALGGETSRFVTVAPPEQLPVELHYLAAGPDTSTDEPAEGSTDNVVDEPEAQPVPLMLLHGFTLNVHSWSSLMPRLAERHRVVAYDQVPYGLSAKPDPAEVGSAPFTLEAAVAHWRALLDHSLDHGTLAEQRVVLIGNSSGAAIALEAAYRHPEHVRGLVLINPMVTVDRPTLPHWLAATPQIEHLNLLAARWIGQRPWLLEASYHDPARLSEERRALATIHDEVAGWDLAWAEIFRRALIEPLDVEQALAKVEVPILVIIGAEDPIIPAADSHQVAARLKSAETVVIDDCGHVPHEECPEAVHTAIKQWLSER
ncbi:hypothetical protein CKO15_00350 [Halorhodospira abdelmalekii]|uniref:alpha/beta fold hydrolase n=1 Tax=Halorhodospira abdelmalekii TaxID=421629 RepID=UPI001907F9CA|nr:alpha/beta hydrolase [Halorhodospira abdelmalekii]MBK1733757.1 hypothetical protein [Halorhodospira abdelmalekii]